MGPRIVIHGGRTGGVQPPPERRKPLHPPKRKGIAPVVKSPAPAAKVVAIPVPPPEEIPAPTAVIPHEYRVIKSRRQSGDPFILQRGNWHEVKGKRTFTVDWEKGFADREKAEKHQAWLERTQQELTDVDAHE